MLPTASHSFQADLTPPEKITLTVCELNLIIKKKLETLFPSIWVTGEISNFSRPASGHMYFSLKDPYSQIKCAFFKQKQIGLSLKPFNGLSVLVRAKPTVYTERGEYQLVIEELLPQGEGALKQQFEILKNKLEALGYFSSIHKKPIPEPNKIKKLGIITSYTGAALQDILSVIKRRWPLISILIFDSLVQGAEAPAQLIKAIQTAHALPKEQQPDCLLISRGGGSLEDLWCFNDEKLCETIFRATIPIVSAVGHEIDFTLCDFVADFRAATPSAGAELLSPDGQALLNYFKNIKKELAKSLNLKLIQYEHQLKNLKLKLEQAHPENLLIKNKEKLISLNKQLLIKINQILDHKKQAYANTTTKLETLSPLNTLKRGFAILQNTEHRVLTHISETHHNQEVYIQLFDGKIRAKII